MSAIQVVKRCPRRMRIRDRRRKKAKRRQRRNLMKFIPSADSDLAHIAQHVFASLIRDDPQTYQVSAENVAEIDKAVSAFRAALTHSLRGGTRTIATIAAKDEARKRLEEVIRRYARIIAANPNVPPSKKSLLRIKERPKKLKQRDCPMKAPTLMFCGSVEGQGTDAFGGGWGGVHLLKFYHVDENDMWRRAKPDAAVRIEVFFDFVPDGEPIPTHPAERSGWPRYLRSYTRSPMRVRFPMPAGGAMRLVYWARWADATGDYGQFSKTCVARMEGGAATPHIKPALQQTTAGGMVSRGVTMEAKFAYLRVESPIAGALPEAAGAEGDENESREGLAKVLEATLGGQRLLESPQVSAARMTDAA